MKIAIACLFFLSGISSLVAAAKVPPPPASRGSPAYLIYQDVDYIAYPDGKQTVCKDLKSFRQTCWQQGIDKGSAAAEHRCLCSSEVAYSVVQCFSAQYYNLTDDAARASYYEDFLAYTYDCYCGVTGVDVTYNSTMNPPTAYIAGYTGDAMLPPDGGCPATQAPSNACPVQPCNCPPPVKPKVPVTCPAGPDRINGRCIPRPPVCEVCQYPFYRGFDGKCICPNGFYRDGNTCRTEKECPPNSDLVISSKGAYCICDYGYVSYHDQQGNLVCKLCCPKGQTRQPDGTCTVDCPDGQYRDWSGKCVCPYGTVLRNGQCVAECVSPLTYSEQFGYCGCYAPYYYDANYNCVLPACNEPQATCYTGLITSTVVETVTSIAPPFNGSTTAIWEPTSTALTVVTTGASTTTGPGGGGDTTTTTSEQGGDTSATSSTAVGPVLPTISTTDGVTSPTATSDDTPPSTPTFPPPTLPSSGGGSGGGSSGGGSSGGSGSGSGGNGGSSGGGTDGGSGSGSGESGGSGSGGSGGGGSGSTGGGSDTGSSGGGDTGSTSGSGDSGSGGSGSDSAGGPTTSGGARLRFARRMAKWL